MLNSRSLTTYENGLKTLLDLCEQCYGPNGTPVFVKSLNSDQFKPSKISFDILNSINSNTNNPLVKTTLNFALEHNKKHGDHTFYLIILALNLYFNLHRRNICYINLLNKLLEIEELISEQMAKQNRFHKLFENNFELLVQLSMSIIKPKLFGFSTSKLESFCRFIVAALLQSIANQNVMTLETWLKPMVLTLPLVTTDPYKYGEIFEGILFPINIKYKIKQNLQRVIELRSFATYELLYKEKRNLNSILMVYDDSKICEIIHEQMEINAKNHLPNIKQTIVDVFESGFIGLLEKSNVGLIIVENEMNGNLKTKLSDRSIFLLEGIDRNLIFQTSKIFNVEIVTSLKIEDTEAFVFQVEVPNLKEYRNHSYLAISKTGIITLIFYRLLDSDSFINEQLSDILFKQLSKILFDKSSHSMTSLCHGAGCTEFLIAGLVLRMGEQERLTPNFWMPKGNYNHSSTQASISESFIRIWELTRDPVNDLQLCKQVDNLLTICQSNFSCVCGYMRQNIDLQNKNILDLTSIKMVAIKNALKLVTLLLRSDLVILQTK